MLLSYRVALFPSSLRIDKCRTNLFRLASAEAQEDVMSSDSVHLIITIGVIVLMFSWVPFINVICPPGWKSTGSPTEKKPEKR